MFYSAEASVSRFLRASLPLISPAARQATPGNSVFNPREDADAQSKILALLLHKSLAPVEKDDPLGVELANKLAELEELRALREDLQLEREITANLAEGKSITRKRGEPCFWKYCV
ncbi:urotensin 2 domain containing [Acanthopagrus schlegelii]